MATAATPQQAIPAQAVDLTVPNPKRTQNLSLPLMQGCEFNSEFNGSQIIVDEGFLKFNLELPSTQNIRLTLNQASMLLGGTSRQSVTITVNDYTPYAARTITSANNSIRIQLDQNARTRVTFKSVGAAEWPRPARAAVRDLAS